MLQAIAAAQGYKTNHRLYAAEETEASLSGHLAVSAELHSPSETHSGSFRKCLHHWKCPDAVHMQQSSAKPEGSCHMVGLVRVPRLASESIKIV